MRDGISVLLAMMQRLDGTLPCLVHEHRALIRQQARRRALGDHGRRLRILEGQEPTPLE